MVELLVVGGGALSEGAVASFAVVEDLDVVEDLGAQLGLREPGAARTEPRVDGGEILGCCAPGGWARNPAFSTNVAANLVLSGDLDEGVEMRIPPSGALGRRVSTSSFCSAYCRDCVLALAALHPSPLASSDFVARRALLTDRLLDLWRHGRGPDPTLVLRAAEVATNGLTLTTVI